MRPKRWQHLMPLSKVPNKVPHPRVGGVVAMMETRSLDDPHNYWVKAIAINQVYAQRHNYSFRLLPPL